MRFCRHLHELQKAGHVRYLGASVYEDAGPAGLQHGGFDCLQIAYNALDRTSEASLLPESVQKGVGIVVRSVLLKGAITPRYRDLPESLHALKSAVHMLEVLALSAGMTLPELAFRYVLGSDGSHCAARRGVRSCSQLLNMLIEVPWLLT